MKLDSKCIKKFPRFLRNFTSTGFYKPNSHLFQENETLEILFIYRNKIHVLVFTKGTFFKERKFVTFGCENWDVQEK